MEEHDFKDELKKKLLAFQRSGLESYLNYLKNEETAARGKSLKQHYHAYLLKEIAESERKIAALDKQLS